MELFLKKKESFSKLVSEIPLSGEPSFDALNCPFKIMSPHGVLIPSPKGLIYAAICGTSIAMWMKVVANMIRKAAYRLDVNLIRNIKETSEYLNESNFKYVWCSLFPLKITWAEQFWVLRKAFRKHGATFHGTVL